MTTYTCESCGTQMTADAQPRECRQCKSRLLNAAPAIATATMPAPTGTVFDPAIAGAAPGSRKKNGLLLYTIMHWAGWGLMIVTYVLGWALLPANQGNGWLPVPGTDWANAAIAMYIVLALMAVAYVTMTIIAIILGLIRLHRAWQCIQPLRQLDPAEANMPTPAKAVGFLFIPGFNVYWVFVALVGLARRMNRYTAERMIPATKVSVGVALSLAIIWLAGNVLGVVAVFTHPLVSWILSPAYAILTYVFIFRITRVTNTVRSA